MVMYHFMIIDVAIIFSGWVQCVVHGVMKCLGSCA